VRINVVPESSQTDSSLRAGRGSRENEPFSHGKILRVGLTLVNTIRLDPRRGPAFVAFPDAGTEMFPRSRRTEAMLACRLRLVGMSQTFLVTLVAQVLNRALVLFGLSLSKSVVLASFGKGLNPEASLARADNERV
jgi:hypothetical protein